ncbi:MAG: histidine kinase [Telmatospirillum sp.]|nr:histidine kinase [Telmatospirillum sp.]
MELLREVTEREGYIRPHHIIGITEFDESFATVRGKFVEHLWALIRYDRTAEEWQHQLHNKIRYIIEYKRAARFTDGKSYDCDLAILTALDTVELSAVRALPAKWEQIEVPHDATTYMKGQFVENDRRLSVIAASAPRMGMAAAAVLTSKVIYSFRPRYVCMVGILAGIPNQANFGDILIPDPSWDWGSGKIEIANGVERFLPAPHQIALNVELREKLKRYSRDETIFARIKMDWNGKKPDTSLRLKIGPVASGAAVLSATDTVAGIRDQQNRKMIGLEMEAYGVMSAGEYASEPRPKIFCAKSVCDFADETKSDDYQAYAAHTSAQFLYRFALDELVPL